MCRKSAGPSVVWDPARAVGLDENVDTLGEDVPNGLYHNGSQLNTNLSGYHDDKSATCMWTRSRTFQPTYYVFTQHIQAYLATRHHILKDA